MAKAHPGIGIVKDSKGNIFYTDLKQVWKITNGKKTIVVPNVHTHELHIDKSDNLYGEGGYYDSQANKFYHYLWVYRSGGRIDTVMGMKEAYVQQDFSLARDQLGTEYYLKRFLPPHTDTNHIYRKLPVGIEAVYATGNFKAVNWLHPQEDGSLLYASNNAIHRVDSLGNIKLVKENIGNAKPTFPFSGNNVMIYGVWQDKTKAIYAAVFSDQTVKKIDSTGTLTNVYRSTGNWAPLHGVFDNDNQLWVLETSDKNEVRVTMAETIPATGAANQSNTKMPIYFMIGSTVLGILLFYLLYRNVNPVLSKRLKN
jgi:hypothetical protein